MELLPFRDILNCQWCSTGWCSFTNPIYYIHWRSTLATRESWHWLLLEALVCWCSLLCGRYHLTSTITACTAFDASNLLWLCQIPLFKTQLIKFSWSLSASTSEFVFCGQKLAFCESVSHLGHILSQDLSDDADIVSNKKDMCRKANIIICFIQCSLLKSK